MDAIYDDMQERSTRLNITNHPTIHDENDPDRCLAIYTLLNHYNIELTQFGGQLFKHLAQIEDTFAYQPGSGLHVTWFQLQQMGKTNICDPSVYSSILQDHMPKLLKLSIRFERLCLTKNSLVALGYVKDDAYVNEWRDSLRAELTEGAIPYDEPYKSDLIHCTLIRFANRPPSSTTINLLRILEKIRIHLFTAHIDRVDTGYSSWHMLAHQLQPCLTKSTSLSTENLF
jgi:hypothetical protein